MRLPTVRGRFQRPEDARCHADRAPGFVGEALPLAVGGANLDERPLALLQVGAVGTARGSRVRWRPQARPRPRTTATGPPLS